MKSRYLFILPILFLTSCGYSLGYLVEGNKYNSPVFKENFYTHWDSELKNAKQGDIDVDTTAISILSFNELYKIDPQVYEKYNNVDDFGADYKMNNIDEMFNYGYQSKLFDGQMVCGGQNGHPEFAYQLGRVQINPDGFSVRFNKESNELKYFATQFKATTDNTVQCYKVNSEELAQGDRDQFHNSKINLNISLYTKNDKNEIVNNSFHREISFNNNNTNNGSYYIFYAFDLSEYNLNRLVGVSYSYEAVEDDLIDWNKTKGVEIDYSVMLYEMFLPYTSWN